MEGGNRTLDDQYVTGLPQKVYCSGSLGEDQQIGAKIVEGQIDFMLRSKLYNLRF